MTMKTCQFKTGSRPASERGSALMAVMWIIALLTMLVGTSALLLNEGVETINTRRDVFRARMLAEAGLAIGASPEVKPDDQDLLRRQVGPDEGFIVSVNGEDGRINPNRLLATEDAQSRGVMLNIARAWGLKLDEAQIVVDSLYDWVDQDDFQRMHGAEKKFYNAPGLPFNRPFRSVDEMAQVRGMGEVERRYPAWREWFSVYSSGTVDVNEASAEVLVALTGADPVMAQQFVARRAGPDGIRHTKDDVLYQDLPSALRMLGVSAANPQFSGSVLGVQSSIVRIESVGVVGPFRRKLFAVLNRGLGSIGGGGNMPGAVAPATPLIPGVGGGPASGAPMGAAQILFMGEQDARGDEGALPTVR
ncbi:MAG: ral secretion pathway protein [Verrucomicrobiaceae bacterium]|nr:ral secretion pathway protein [Verrucomicrobiaceae bacterium]